MTGKTIAEIAETMPEVADRLRDSFNATTMQAIALHSALESFADALRAEQAKRAQKRSRKALNRYARRMAVVCERANHAVGLRRDEAPPLDNDGMFAIWNDVTVAGFTTRKWARRMRRWATIYCKRVSP